MHNCIPWGSYLNKLVCLLPTWRSCWCWYDWSNWWAVPDPLNHDKQFHNQFSLSRPVWGRWTSSRNNLCPVLARTAPRNSGSGPRKLWANGETTNFGHTGHSDIKFLSLKLQSLLFCWTKLVIWFFSECIFHHFIPVWRYSGTCLDKLSH